MKSGIHLAADLRRESELVNVYAQYTRILISLSGTFDRFMSAPTSAHKCDKLCDNTRKLSRDRSIGLEHRQLISHARLIKRHDIGILLREVT